MEDLPPVDDDHVIEFFPDFGAPSPLWSHLGLTDPRTLGLNEELARRLEAWASFWDDHANTDEADFSNYNLDGDALAQEVANALGSNWAIARPTLHDGGGQRRLIRSSLPPADPGAAKAAEALSGAARERDARIRAIHEAGGRIEQSAIWPRGLTPNVGTRPDAPNGRPA